MNQNPIQNLMIEWGLLGQEGWLIDKQEELQILQEILETWERYPGADHQKITFEINAVRTVHSLPLVEEDWVYRLMYEAGLLEEEQIFTIEDKEIFDEIREILKLYPNAGYLKVTAELNRARLARGDLIIFWPRVYRLMQITGLVGNSDALVFKEITQILNRYPGLKAKRVTENDQHHPL